VDFDAAVLVPSPICPSVQEFLMRIEFWSYRTDFHFRASASEIRTPVAATISRSVYSGWTSLASPEEQFPPVETPPP
jgi:hypothetical protein